MAALLVVLGPLIDGLYLPDEYSIAAGDGENSNANDVEIQQQVAGATGVPGDDEEEDAPVRPRSPRELLQRQDQLMEDEDDADDDQSEAVYKAMRAGRYSTDAGVMM